MKGEEKLRLSFSEKSGGALMAVLFWSLSSYFPTARVTIQRQLRIAFDRQLDGLRKGTSYFVTSHATMPVRVWGMLHLWGDLIKRFGSPIA